MVRGVTFDRAATTADMQSACKARRGVLGLHRAAEICGHPERSFALPEASR